jgi:hypothetical protein
MEHHLAAGDEPEIGDAAAIIVGPLSGVCIGLQPSRLRRPALREFEASGF